MRVDSMLNKGTEDFVKALIALDRLTAQELMDQYTNHSPPIQFIENVVVTALEYIGEKWLQGDFALSQVYMAGRICEQLIDSVLPPGAPDRKDQPKMAICVLNDHHGLGKTIVYSLLRASGFEILDFGFVDDETLIQKIEDEGIKIILISVLMLPSALKIKTVKEEIVLKKMDVKIIVGGAPFRFDKQLWKEIGADAMCETASQTIDAIEKLLEVNQ